MEDIRLKTTKYTVAGKEYELRCNMNVLADVQEANGGDLAAALADSRSMKTALQLGAAMLNDCADANGWPERFTERQLGRLIPPKEIGKFSAIVTDLLYSALRADDEEADNGEEKEDTEKN